MRIVYSLVLYLVVNFIELSSQSYWDWPDTSRPGHFRSSFSPHTPQSPDKPGAEPPLPIRSRSPPARPPLARTPPTQIAESKTERPLRVRSRSPPARSHPAMSPPASSPPTMSPPARPPPARPPPARSPPARSPPARSPPARSPPARPTLVRTPVNQVLGYGLGQLGLIRLIPNINKYRRFEFRRYTFNSDSGLLCPVSRNVYEDVPVAEQIVLTTSNGDVMAILETDGILTGIYWRRKHKSRVKINIDSGVITSMTPNEMRECPVGARRRIGLNFTIVVVKQDSLQLNQ